MSRHHDLGPEMLPIPSSVFEPASVPKALELPKKIDREDRLQADVLQLRMQNIQLQLQIMQADLQQAMKNRGEVVAEMVKFRETFQAKYGVDIGAINIHEDGTYDMAVKTAVG